MASQAAQLKFTFDVKRVIGAMNRKTKKVLYGAGQYTRKTMKSNMRKTKAISAPGGYPSSHEGTLRRLIYFGVDEAAGSVTVGPIEFKGKRPLKASSRRTVPDLLNRGGSVRGVDSRGRRRTMIYRPRPFVALTRPAAVRVMIKNMKEFSLK